MERRRNGREGPLEPHPFRAKTARMHVGDRVAVYGPSGSGKTTLARRLGEQLGLPVVELDAIMHSRPDWNDLSIEEFRAAVTEILEQLGDRWVIEGNYRAVRDLILPYATTAVWLRLPFHTVYPRLVSRTLRRGIRRELLWGSNRESLRMAFTSRDSMLLWGVTAWRGHRRQMTISLAAAPPSVRVVVLRTPRAVRRFTVTARR